MNCAHKGNDTWKQYRGSGKPHGDIERPNIKETEIGMVTPEGKVFINGSTVRKPTANEYPGGE